MAQHSPGLGLVPCQLDLQLWVLMQQYKAPCLRMHQCSSSACLKSYKGCLTECFPGKKCHPHVLLTIGCALAATQSYQCTPQRHGDVFSPCLALRPFTNASSVTGQDACSPPLLVCWLTTSFLVLCAPLPQSHFPMDRVHLFLFKTMG